MTPTRGAGFEARLCVALAMFCLPVFLAGTSPLLYWRDSAEFAMLGRNLDIGHPAGSPLFAMFARAFDALPIGAASFRAALLTIVSACAAVSAIAWLLLRIGARLRVSHAGCSMAAALAVGAFAFSRAWYEWVVAPEVYAAQVLFLALFGICALRVIPEGDTAPDRRYAWLAAFMLGLGCAAHMGTLLLAPGLVLLLWLPMRRHWRARHAAMFATFCIIGFSVYAYLPVRSATDPPFDQGNPEFWGAFVAHITGSRYSGIIHSFPWPRVWYDLKALAAHFPDQLSWPVAVAALAGLAVIARRQRALLPGIALAVAGHLYLYIKDWHRAFGYIPLFAGASLLAGVAVLAAMRRLETERTGLSRLFVALVGVVAAALFATQSLAALRGGSRADHDLMHRHVRSLMDSLPHGAIYVSYQDANSYSVFYAQSIERYREDIRHLHRAFLGFPDYLKQRDPDLVLDGYQPRKPFAAQEMLLRSAGDGGVFWDYGWEDRPYYRDEVLKPWAFVYRLTDDPAAPATLDPAMEKRWIRAPIDHLDRFGFDWTARQVYSQFYSLAAKYEFDRGRLDEAGRRIERAVAIWPDSGAVRGRRAAWLAASNRWEDAWREAVEATRLEPYLIDSWMYRAQFARETGRRDDALESWRAALRLNRFHSFAAASYAAMLMEEQKYGAAAKQARRAVAGAQNRVDRARARQILARAWVGAGRCDKALPMLERMARRDPNDTAIAGLRDHCRAGGGTSN